MKKGAWVVCVVTQAIHRNRTSGISIYISIPNTHHSCSLACSVYIHILYWVTGSFNAKLDNQTRPIFRSYYFVSISQAMRRKELCAWQNKQQHMKKKKKKLLWNMRIGIILVLLMYQPQRTTLPFSSLFLFCTRMG